MNNKKTAKAITKCLAQQKRQQINKIIDNWKEPKMKRTVKTKVTKRYWYDVLGGFANPNCFRKHNGKVWEYFYHKQLD